MGEHRCRRFGLRSEPGCRRPRRYQGGVLSERAGTWVEHAGDRALDRRSGPPAYRCQRGSGEAAGSREHRSDRRRLDRRRRPRLAAGTVVGPASSSGSRRPVPAWIGAPRSARGAARFLVRAPTRRRAGCGCCPGSRGLRGGARGDRAGPGPHACWRRCRGWGAGGARARWSAQRAGKRRHRRTRLHSHHRPVGRPAGRGGQRTSDTAGRGRAHRPRDGRAIGSPRVGRRRAVQCRSDVRPRLVRRNGGYPRWIRVGGTSRSTGEVTTSTRSPR